MTIKRRLTISNFLMLVLPIAASITLAYLILFVFTERSTEPMDRAFPKAYEMLTRHSRHTDLDRLTDDVRQFNDEFDGTPVTMAIIRDNRLYYPDRIGESEQGHTILSTLIENGVTGTVSINDIRIMIEPLGDYKLLVVDTASRQKGGFLERGGTLHPLPQFGLLLLMILLTNRLLTAFVSRSITGSLQTLSDGVHELRDGNLTYRIDYKRRDEFAEVCNDFNEMAFQLQQLVERQQKDDASRKELLAGISHDLRTPLTAINAYVEGLLDGVATDREAQLKYLGVIRKKAGEIDRLVDQLFAFSKLEIDEFPFCLERLDIARMLSEMVESAGEEYLSKGIGLVPRFDAAPLHVRADAVQLQTVLTNILENSAKYRIRERGRVTIDCRERGRDVEIRLTDDGPGVTGEQLARLFELFYRTDPSRRNPGAGSGLGLAISARIMERMDGTITAENAEAGGLRIIITLPKYSQEEPTE